MSGETAAGRDRDGLAARIAGLDARRRGEEIYDLARELFPICRSITGEGLRRSFEILGRMAPLELRSVPSGTRVFDWTVPPEWTIREAWVRDPRGRKIVDFAQNNLHVMGYSTPVRGRLSLEALRPHLHFLPDQADRIPYRTSYYAENWGFCVTRRLYESLEPGEYEVVIDSKLEPGRMDYAELLVPGTSGREVLLSCHCCHPSLANDNVSAMAVAAVLARTLLGARLRHGVRFLFAPGTIGAIAWLERNRARRESILGALVLACLGDPGEPTYKRSRAGDARIDRAVEHVLAARGGGARIEPFVPWGYDERQFNSPGILIPAGRLTRTPNGAYPEYHTSADDLSLIAPEHLGDSLATLLRILHVLEEDGVYRNTNPCCEPQLGRRGLYGAIGGMPRPERSSLAMLWLLNLSDGRHSLLDVAARSGMPFDVLAETARLLADRGLLQRMDD